MKTDEGARTAGGEPEDRTVIESGADPDPEPTPSVLDRIHLPLAETLKARLRLHGEGGRIGRYLVLRLLGEGGMGTVFSAYDDELDRKVAIKLLRSDGPAGRLDRAWLLAEAKAMARISHPNVVQIYDVGEAADPSGEASRSQIFVAMELISGTTLSAWLRGAKRGRAEIVDRFIQAGQGLLAVHEAGLVHRDFKPQNVLVGDDGRVRVLDFGLAYRPLDDGSGGVAGGSSGGSSGDGSQSHAGTPAYMAPEQHLMAEIDARADQFAFGVALYEALHGERPFKGKDAREVAAAILADDRRAPSGDARVPAHLRRIIDRALRPSASDRYPSMAALLVDLRADPWRARKIALALVVVVAVVAAVIYAVDARRVEAAEREAQACAGGEARLAGVYDEARRERARAAFAATGLVFAADTWAKAEARLEGYASRWTAAHRAICEDHRRDVLSSNLFDRASACLDGARRDLGALVDVYVDADAQTVERAIKASERLPALEHCQDREVLVGRVPPPDDAATATAVEAVRADLARIMIELDTSHTARCAEIPGLSARAKELAYRPIAAEVAIAASRCAEIKGEYEAAIESMKAAGFIAIGAADDRLAIDALHRVAYLLAGKFGRAAEAEPWIRLARALAERFGDDDEVVARLLLSKGGIDLVTGRLDDARVAFEESRDRFRRRFGDGNSNLALAINNLAVAHARLGHHGEVIDSFAAAVEVTRRVLGPDHPDTLTIATNLGAAYLQAHDFDRARPILEETLARKEALVGADHPDIAIILISISALHQRLFKHDHDRAHLDIARDTLERARAIRERALGPDNTRTAFVLTALGEVYNERGEPAKAREILERGDAIYLKSNELATPTRAYLLARLGRARNDLGQAKAAIPLLEESLKIHLASPSQPEEASYTRFQLARALVRASRKPAERARARALAEVALAGFKEQAEVFADEIAEVEAWLAERG